MALATVNRLRRDVGTLTDGASSDLTRVWAAVGTPAAAQVALHDLLPGVIDSYGAAAATIAAEWYDDLRSQRSVPGRFAAIPADVANTGAHALIGWALSEANDYPAFQTLVLGGMQRRVANFSRLTVMGASTADPHARGWRRVGLGNCDFCRMLIGRGAVYTEATADFESHDHCHCGAEPDF